MPQTWAQVYELTSPTTAAAVTLGQTVADVSPAFLATAPSPAAVDRWRDLMTRVTDFTQDWSSFLKTLGPPEEAVAVDDYAHFMNSAHQISLHNATLSTLQADINVFVDEELNDD